MNTQSYTAQGRAKTCPWISLRGKEWKALSEIRDAQVAIRDSLAVIAQAQQDLVAIERQKLELLEIEHK